MTNFATRHFQSQNLDTKSPSMKWENMLDQKNPAAQLYMLLKTGRGYSGDYSCYSVWAKLLDTDDDVVLTSRLGKVMGLVYDTVLELRQICPDQEHSWSHWVSTVNCAFMSMDLRGSWASFDGLIDNHTINYLKFTAEILEKNYHRRLALRYWSTPQCP